MCELISSHQTMCQSACGYDCSSVWSLSSFETSLKRFLLVVNIWMTEYFSIRLKLTWGTRILSSRFQCWLCEGIKLTEICFFIYLFVTFYMNFNPKHFRTLDFSIHPNFQNYIITKYRNDSYQTPLYPLLFFNEMFYLLSVLFLCNINNEIVLQCQQ